MALSKKLNLGCGSHFHKDWVNVDFNSNSEYVMACNLLKGIPFSDNEFDIVYSSHVLEHFPKNEANNFIKECYRVLKPDGILRIVVPDLERIAKLYIEKLEKAYSGDKSAESDYDWIMLEMYDQVVRNYTGGNMLEYLKQDNIENIDFIYERIGYEAKNIINSHKLIKENKAADIPPKKCFSIKRLLRFLKLDNHYKQIGQFRLGGEIHQWMYDKFSLKRILENNGFKNIEIKSAYESNFEDWSKYNLDLVNKSVRKPDSLFMEAIK